MIEFSTFRKRAGKGACVDRMLQDALLTKKKNQFTAHSQCCLFDLSKAFVLRTWSEEFLSHFLPWISVIGFFFLFCKKVMLPVIVLVFPEFFL